jgi:hypothetical protein
MQRSRVDFPEPEGPIMATTSPLSTEKLRLSSTRTLPKDFARDETSRIGMYFSLNDPYE